MSARAATELIKIPLKDISGILRLVHYIVNGRLSDALYDIHGQQVYLIRHEGYDTGNGAETLGYTVQAEPPVTENGTVKEFGNLHPYRGSFSIALGPHRVVGHSRTHLHLEPVNDVQEEA